MDHPLNVRVSNEVEIYPDAGTLARAAANYFVALANEAFATRGRFAVALAGGSTPKAMYARLASDEFAMHVDWQRVHLFWGDERCVAPDHPGSNYGMVRQAWLDQVPIPADNVHRMRGEMEPVQAAADYEQVLGTFFSLPLVRVETHDKTPTPRFDLILLGMGDDGHTASLFPGAAAIREQRRWVVADFVEKLGAWRVTLTPAVINAAADVIFLVSGPGKAERLRQVLAEPHQPDRLPAQIVRPARGRLRWLVDAAAATLYLSVNNFSPWSANQA